MYENKTLKYEIEVRISNVEKEIKSAKKEQESNERNISELEAGKKS